MGVGKLVRLNRLFAHPSGRLCSVAIDHFIDYDGGLPDSLRHIVPTLAAIMAGQPDAITMHKGVATSAWGPYAGQAALIIQSTLARVDGLAHEQWATPEEVVRLGADAIAVTAFVRGDAEARQLRVAGEVVREAERFDLPVIFHIYPRHLDGIPRVSHEPEDIAWAVRCAVETGVDVVKTSYCGDSQAFAEIVADSPIPVVCAGGPQSGGLAAALEMMAEAIGSGARGATVGRNIWGFPQIAQAVEAFKAVIHDGKTAREALEAIQAAGL
jgi:class I fructose-bisphosphate aldolase